MSLLALATLGCSDDEERYTLKPVLLGMTSDMAPVYDDGNLALYEAKLPVQLPISQFGGPELEELNQQDVPPYGRMPWVITTDVKIQVSWTLTNLDPEPHAVEILIDPWNEFVRYWPGMAVTNVARQELLPNLSGIDLMIELPGTNSGDDSRRWGTFTFQDMDEVAIDLATVMNLLEIGPPPNPEDPESDPLVALANHTFAIENRSYDDPLVAAYIPAIVAALTGFDLGLRSYTPANLAVEIVIEVVDKAGNKVLDRHSSEEPLEIPDEYITVGYGG